MVVLMVAWTVVCSGHQKVDTTDVWMAVEWVGGKDCEMAGVWVVVKEFGLAD